jgi:hypothetical protein
MITIAASKATRPARGQFNGSMQAARQLFKLKEISRALPWHQLFLTCSRNRII